MSTKKANRNNSVVGIPKNRKPFLKVGKLIFIRFSTFGIVLVNMNTFEILKKKICRKTFYPFG